MRSIEYKAPEGFEGSAQLQVPKYTERLKIIKNCNFSLGTEGEAQVTTDQLDSVIALIEGTKGYIKDVKIKHVESGAMAESFEDLEYSPEFDGLLVELCSSVLNAGQVGNS